MTDIHTHLSQDIDLLHEIAPVFGVERVLVDALDREAHAVSLAQTLFHDREVSY